MEYEKIFKDQPDKPFDISREEALAILARNYVKPDILLRDLQPGCQINTQFAIIRRKMILPEKTNNTVLNQIS